MMNRAPIVASAHARTERRVHAAARVPRRVPAQLPPTKDDGSDGEFQYFFINLWFCYFSEKGPSERSHFINQHTLVCAVHKLCPITVRFMKPDLGGKNLQKKTNFVINFFLSPSVFYRSRQLFQELFKHETSFFGDYFGLKTSCRLKRKRRHITVYCTVMDFVGFFTTGIYSN